MNGKAILSFALAFATVATSPLAFAVDALAPPGLIHFTLGQSLGIPICSPSVEFRECQRPQSKSAGMVPGEDVRLVSLSQDDARRFSFIPLRSYIWVSLLDGKIEHVRIPTTGIRSQETVLNLLKEKFGEPTEVERTQMKTGAGAEFAVIRADWKLAGAAIKFYGASGRIDGGSVTLATDKYWSLAIEKTKADRPKF